jgi:hypothetical protein
MSHTYFDNPTQNLYNIRRIPMQQISISQIQRNLHTLDNFDIIEVIDKKRNKVKGWLRWYMYYMGIMRYLG